MTRTDGLDTLAALTRWARTLARRAATDSPAERIRILQRFPRRDAARCAAAIGVRCLVGGRRVPWSGVLLFAATVRAAEARSVTSAALVREAIARAVDAALPDVSRPNQTHIRG